MPQININNTSSPKPKETRRFSLPFFAKKSKVEPAKEEPCRFSYVRASNSYHRYGRRKSTKTSEDTSVHSSKEDLLEKTSVRVKRKKFSDKSVLQKNHCDKNKLGFSSSEDILNYESDAVSSGIPETDGSVFSSQEDLLETSTNCSENISRFMRRSSSGKGSYSSGISNSIGANHSVPFEIRVTSAQSQEEQTNPLRNEPYFVDRYTPSPIYCGSDDEILYRHSPNHFHSSQSIQLSTSPLRQSLDCIRHFDDVQPTSPYRYSPYYRHRSPSLHCISPARQYLRTVSPNPQRSLSRQSIEEVEEEKPLRLKVQLIIAKTMNRLVDHLGNINNQVGVIDTKCNHLRNTIGALEYDQYLLHAKFYSLEKRIEDINENETNISDTDCGCPTGQAGEEVLIKESKNASVEPSDTIERTCEVFDFRQSLHFTACTTFHILDIFKALLSRLQKVKRKSKSSSSRFWSILFLVLTAAVLWDIKSAGSFYGSKVGLAIERTGLMPYAEAFGRGVRTGAIQAYRWCIHNIPFYYSKGCDLAEPYLLLVWSRVEWIFTNCWTGIQSAVNYIPVLKENIETSFPGLSASLSYYGNAALEGGQKAFVVVKDVSAPYLLQVHNFVSTKILVGALAPEKLHDYLFGSLDYITHLFYRIHSALLDVTATEVENITAKSSL